MGWTSNRRSPKFSRVKIHHNFSSHFFHRLSTLGSFSESHCCRQRHKAKHVQRKWHVPESRNKLFSYCCTVRGARVRHPSYLNGAVSGDLTSRVDSKLCVRRSSHRWKCLRHILLSLAFARQFPVISGGTLASDFYRCRLGSLWRSVQGTAFDQTHNVHRRKLLTYLFRKKKIAFVDILVRTRKAVTTTHRCNEADCDMHGKKLLFLQQRGQTRYAHTSCTDAHRRGLGDGG